MMTDQIVIDDEFAALIPPPSEEELRQLEANLAESGGARDALVAWASPDGAVLLDGHNRHRICTRLGLPYRVEEMEFPDRGHAMEWLIRNQFGRRNLSAYDRTTLALRLEESIAARAKANQASAGGDHRALCQKSDKALSTIDTKREIAAAAGVSHDTVAKVKRIAEAVEAGEVPVETVAKLRSGEVSINRVDREIKTKRTEARAKQAKAEAASKGVLHECVRVGDFRTALDDLPDGCVDLIFTDPPYDKETVPLYEDMGRIAARVLRPGGSLITYLGQYAMPQVCDLVGRHLKFLWPLCCLHDGPGSVMALWGIRVKWKPMLWFVNGGNRYDTSMMVEDLVVSTKEKSDHPWQQAVVEAEYYIRKLTPEGGLVVDPFCGGGTTAIAALRAGRQVVTCDVDAEWARVASARIQETAG